MWAAPKRMDRVAALDQAAVDFVIGATRRRDADGAFVQQLRLFAQMGQAVAHRARIAATDRERIAMAATQALLRALEQQLSLVQHADGIIEDLVAAAGW